MYPIPPSSETRFLTDAYIGRWLKASGAKREELVIATKVSGYSERNSWCRTPPETTRVTAAQIAQSVDASLARLGVSEIDLLQVHW